MDEKLTQNDCDQPNDILHTSDESITSDDLEYEGTIDWIRVSDDDISAVEDDVLSDDEQFSKDLERHIKSVVFIGLNNPHGDPEGLILKVNQLMELYFYDEVRTVRKEK